MNGQIVSSGTCVLPTSTAPAWRSRRTTSLSCSAGVAVVAGVPVGGDVAGDVGVVLDRHGDPEQQALVPGPEPGVGLVGLGHRPLGEHDAEGVELGLQALDARQALAHQLARGHVARRDATGLLRGAGEGEVVEVHGRAEP